MNPAVPGHTDRGVMRMDISNMPAGFLQALARNAPAMAAFAGMDGAQQRLVLEKARRARSEAEMRQVANTLANSPM